MKFTTLAVFTLLLFSFYDRKGTLSDTALNFFPDSKTGIIKAGFQLQKGLPNEHYKKVYGDTIVYFHYPTEESKYYKLIQFNFDKIDTVSFYNFVNQNKSTVNQNNIILIDQNNIERTFFLNVDRRKRFAQLLYVHPDYEKYKDKIDTIQAPEAIEN